MSWLPDWLTGYDPDNAAAANAADMQRRELDRAAYESGRITWNEYQRRQAGGYGVDVESQRQEIDQTFADSVKDNAGAISSGVNSALGFTLKKIFGAIPWQLWAVGAVALFVWAGGLAWLKGRLK